MNIEHIPIRGSVQRIGRSIEKQETLPAPNRSLHQKFPLIKNQRAFFILKRSDIAIVDSVEVNHEKNYFKTKRV